MSIRCPNCNFEIILANIRPGRFSPTCEACGQIFTLYVAFDASVPPMPARSHVELHEQCLAMGIPPPEPYPPGATKESTTEPVLNLMPPPLPEPAEEPSPLEELASAVQTTRPKEPVTLWRKRRFGEPRDWIFSPYLRFGLGVLILIGFLLWWQQNRGGRTVEGAYQGAVQVTSARREMELATAEPWQRAGKITMDNVGDSVVSPTTNPSARVLEAPFLPTALRRALSGWNALVAGLILLASSLCRGRLLTVAVMLATIVALVGHWPATPPVPRLDPWVSAVAAGALAVLALFFLRVRPEEY